MARITKIERPEPIIMQKKRVAAYARVSSPTVSLLHSLSAQISYYSTLIQSNPEWEYAGVYADEGITGTSTVKRDKFRELIADCEAGKIDLVLTKSISRFARNTVDLLNTIRHLKDLGVEVQFERERINTGTADGEFLLTLLASFAQAESQSISENAKWSIRNGYKQGISHGHFRALGYRWNGEEYCIVPEEAEIIKFIFENAAQGASPGKISRALKEKDVRGISGKFMNGSTITEILKNELYIGDLVLQKAFCYTVGKKKRNYGEEPQYVVQDDHEAIISRALFDKVKEQKALRLQNTPKKEEKTCFSGNVICGECGYKVNRRHIVHSRKAGNQTYKRWVCNAFEDKGRDFCDLPALDEDDLRWMAAKALNSNILNEDEYRRKIKMAVIYYDRVDFVFYSGKRFSVDRDYRNLPAGKTCFTGKIVCGKCGGACHNVSIHKKRSWMCRTHRDNKSACDLRNLPFDEMIIATKEVLGESDKTETAFIKYVKTAEIFDDRIEFHMRDGETLLWQRQ